jgi:CRP-like cAMP-binding protein
MGIGRDVDALAAVPLFRDLSDAQRKLVCFTSDRLVFRTGQVMFRQGDVSDSAYVILDGAADITIATPNGPVKVATIGPQAIVGEMGVITGAARSATVTAAGETAALRIARDGFVSLVEGFPAFSLALVRELAVRLENTNRVLAAMNSAKAPAE